MSTSDVVAIVALVVAVTSFLIALAQVLQQYVATADGYRRCREAFLGPWAQFTRRKFHWTEFRFEVRYRAPTLFLSKPDKGRGPIPGAPIQNLDGATDDLELNDPFSEQPGRMTWLALLSTITFCERTSRSWDQKRRTALRDITYGPPYYSLCVQIQSSEHSWDFMPEAVLRPFAHTTVSHLAELGAMLGMRWIIFEPIAGTLMASGNGMELISSTVPGQGIMASFYRTGRVDFEGTRIIPGHSIKDIVWGSVPTIWGKELNLGDAAGTARSLLEMACSRQTIDEYLYGGPRLDLAQVVDYELLGMFASVIRLRGSHFRRIPNPTRHPYTRRLPILSSLRALVEHIQNRECHFTVPANLKALLDVWKDEDWPRSGYRDIVALETTHDILDGCDQSLVDWGEKYVMKLIGAYVSILNELRQANKPWGSFETGSELMEHYFAVVLPRLTQSLENSKVFHSPSGSGSPTLYAQDGIKAVWYALVLRMLCWWVLHEISEDTNTALPGQWKDSRSPVLLL